MSKREIVLGWLVVVAACVLVACEGTSTSTAPAPIPGKGTLVTFVGDDGVCGILAFRPLITGLTLTPMGGTAGPSLLSSAASVKINFAALRDFTSVLDLASVNEGTYTSATITLSAPQLARFDPSQTPPIGFLTLTLTTSSPQVTFDSPLKITKNKVSGLRLDFDLVHSFQVDDQGQLTGNVTPTFRGRPVTPSTNQGFGEIDDLVGFVQRVDTSSANPKFIGHLQVQLLQNTGPSIVVSLTSTTQLFGASALNTLPTGSFVEVDGFVDSDGNFVANAIEVEDREVVEQNMVAMIGPVMSLTRDPSGNLTQFSLDVRETEPDVPFDINSDSVVVVNVTSSTAYQFSSRSTNFAGLSFDPTALAVGQEVVVHGTFTKPTEKTQPTTVAADKVYLKLQSIQGQFSSLVQSGSDDKTGAFKFSSCFPLLSGTRILVVTNAQTSFVGVGGLNELTAQPSLLVKGLPFFEKQATTVNGVAVPAGTLVLVAKQVHQL